MQITRFHHVLTAGTVLLTFCGVLRADPSHQDFDAALAVHGQTLSPELQQRAQSLYETANEALIGFATTLSKSRNARLDGKKIGQTHVALVQSGRLGLQLQLLGEPAGADYLARAVVLRRGLSKIVLSYQSSPAGQAFMKSIRLQLARQEPVRMKTLRRVHELATQRKWPEAEEALRSDLMVSDHTQPLTLAAAKSLISGERGDFVSVGGTIGGLHLESLITRFASLPAPAAVLTPLGAVPREQVSHDFASQMLMRFDLQPRWAQHEHFFIEFAPPADPGMTR